MPVISRGKMGVLEGVCTGVACPVLCSQGPTAALLGRATAGGSRGLCGRQRRNRWGPGTEICGPAGATARWGLLVRSDGASPALLAAHRDSAALAPARSMGLGGSGVWTVGPVPPPVASVDPLGMALCSFPQGPRGPLDSGPKYKHGAVTVALR